ncbi:MAG: hypothetical protein DCC71_03855 [Proteobacteria bacterium]|nr:MAG: hypothetical protein DCC71_03855 [Pseudomonadota bacterium]
MATETGSEPTADPRVLLAAERTLLAWIRTGVALMAFGFVVARFSLFLGELAAVSGHPLPARSHASPVGVALVVAGLLLNFWASLRHRNMIARLRKGEGLERSERGPIAIGVATAVGGVVMVLLLLEAVSG